LYNILKKFQQYVAEVNKKDHASNLINIIIEKGSDTMDKLFTPKKIKDLEIKNRIVLPPMVAFTFADDNNFVSEKKYKSL